LRESWGEAVLYLSFHKGYRGEEGRCKKQAKGNKKMGGAYRKGRWGIRTMPELE
jgi:hypothetical protein